MIFIKAVAERCKKKREKKKKAGKNESGGNASRDIIDNLPERAYFLVFNVVK